MGKFTIKKTDAGFSFNLVADNNEIIATSEVYTTKAACKKGMKFEVFIDKAGEFRFHLKAGNGEIIAASEGYKAKDGCLKGIESVKDNSAWSDVVEV